MEPLLLHRTLEELLHLTRKMGLAVPKTQRQKDKLVAVMREKMLERAQNKDDCSVEARCFAVPSLKMSL